LRIFEKGVNGGAGRKEIDRGSLLGTNTGSATDEEDKSPKLANMSGDFRDWEIFCCSNSFK
jgi:hypothetical protein